jgi:hypothetical protein
MNSIIQSSKQSRFVFLIKARTDLHDEHRFVRVELDHVVVELDNGAVLVLSENVPDLGRRLDVVLCLDRRYQARNRGWDLMSQRFCLKLNADNWHSKINSQKKSRNELCLFQIKIFYFFLRTK